MKAIVRALAATISGAIFGLGLSLSGMLNPARIRGFLDVAGNWDPSLAFVLGGAVCVATIGIALQQRLRQPAFDSEFYLPTNRRIDRPLIVGSVLFGIGWGVAGLCPGPAIASLSLGLEPTMLFVLTMLVGMIIHDRFFAK